MQAIQYLKREEINDAKWDACMDAAGNGLIYGYTFYLDAMCTNWDALVLNDYEAIMPLPFKIKFGIRYVCMPAFTQQLGCFSAIAVSYDIIAKFLEQAKHHFRFGDYHFNYSNRITGFQQRNNFVLSLKLDYTAIRENYKHDLKKNIARAKRFSLFYESTNDYTLAIDLFQSLYIKRDLSIEASDYFNFKNLCSVLIKKGELLIRNVKDSNKLLLSTAVCLKDNNRLYLILSVTTEMGRSMEANHLLLDRLIHEFAAQPIQLDFEGSDIPGIAHFYKNFGGKNEPYYFLRWNKLPWPVRLLKT